MLTKTPQIHGAFVVALSLKVNVSKLSVTPHLATFPVRISMDVMKQPDQKQVGNESVY